MEIDNQELKFHAAINGVNLDADQQNESPVPRDKSSIENSPKVPLFGDPNDYAGYSEDEKQSMTEKMQGRHKSWSSDMKAK